MKSMRVAQLKNIFPKSLFIKSEQSKSDKILIKKTKGGICDGKRSLCLITGFFGFKRKLQDETEHTDHARGHDSLSYP